MVAIKAILVLTGCFVLSAYAAEPNCQGSAGKDDQVCEKWASLRFLWSFGSTLKLTNPVSLDSGTLDPKKNNYHTLTMNCVNNGDNGAQWFGRRVAYGDKQSVVALYDVKGSIAGIQARYPKSSVNPAAGFRHADVGMFQSETINGVPHWVLTAYFVDPNTICSSGRDKGALTTNEGTGNRLVFQNGKTPSSLLKAPRMRPDALSMGYSNNTCFPSMGSHTFFGVDGKPNDCKTIMPVFLLYNKANYMVGFGFDWVGKNTDDNSFESPPADAIDKIVGGAPKCLLDFAKNKEIGITTMHVFFVNRNPSVPC
jgi:charged multivesicular body protein 7